MPLSGLQEGMVNFLFSAFAVWAHFSDPPPPRCSQPLLPHSLSTDIVHLYLYVRNREYERADMAARSANNSRRT